ncbi:MAG: hypothetical protein ABSB18_07615 [Candidatus Omnitrophota bacterium]
MEKQNKFSIIFLRTIALGLCLWYVAIIGGPNLLKLYINTGIGDCNKIPILCMVPVEKITPQASKECLRDFLPYSFPNIQVCLPDGFKVTCELAKKEFYKKKINRQNKSFAYLLYEEPGFFMKLFPQSKKAGANNNYEFIKRVMYANTNAIKNLNDTFFVIMKSFFIADLGDQKEVKMAQVEMGDKRGFLSYNIGKDAVYFECSLVDSKDQFFKIYVRDKTRQLNPEKIFTVISTLDKP